MKFGVGQAVRRKEDVRFVTGRGCYTDDLAMPNQAYGVVVRSTHAHAGIGGIDVAAARAAPGIVAVFTHAELDELGIGPMPCVAPVKNRDGSDQALPDRPVLARGRVRYVGEPVAFVVADSAEAARDAAELVEVDYEPLPAVGTIEAAVASDAPPIWEEAPGNIAYDWQMGDAAAVDAAFAAADRVVRLDLVHNRVVPNPMEPRACIAEYDAASDRTTLHTSSQGAHGLRERLAGMVFNEPLEKLRVVTPDVGGGFGMKIFPFPEHVLTIVAARELKRPVRWTGGRDEAFLGDTHGRDARTHGELALDRDGRILALRVTNRANLGAYNSTFGPMVATAAGGRILGGVYAIPAVLFRVKGVFTNSGLVDAYRGAGRPEAAYIIERLVDAAGRETGLGPAEIRRRNFMKPESMPHTNWWGIPFDSGDFARNLADALQFAEYDTFEARRAAARARGRRRGIGVSYYVEITGGSPIEHAEIKVLDGAVEVVVGTQSNGQGHETTFAQLVAERLGVPFDAVRVRCGDSDVLPTGGGTGGSRSLHMAGGAIRVTADRIEAKGRRLAAHLLEAAEADVEFRVEADGAGRFRIVGTDRAVGLFDVARAARTPGLPDGLATDFAAGLAEIGTYNAEASTLPNGCHVCEIEIDEATGTSHVVSYHVVDDFGRIVNPLIVEGQVHGGVAQGIGQALLEDCRYEADSGQLITGSFMDYGMPRADDVPWVRFAYNEIPCRTNPLGVKGCGEAGTVGALAAVMNAVVDALGVRHIDMPATPEKLWRAMHRADAQQ
jgi:carbon-monoxide dehydrogenase large subunit